MHWLWEHEGSRVLMREVEAESKRVWKFIIDREIEAPERFRAIQSYRCTPRVLPAPCLSTHPNTGMCSPRIVMAVLGQWKCKYV